MLSAMRLSNPGRSPVTAEAIAPLFGAIEDLTVKVQLFNHALCQYYTPTQAGLLNVAAH